MELLGSCQGVIMELLAGEGCYGFTLELLISFS